MRAYLRLARMTLRVCFVYWDAFVLGTVGRCFGLLATVAVWSALLGGGARLGGYDLPEMKAYLLVGFITAVLGSALGDHVMAERIHSGMISLDLVKPINYQRMQFAQTIGGLGMDLTVIAVAGAGFVLLAGPVTAPVHTGLFLVSLLFVVPIKFLIIYMSTLLCFWTQSYHGVVWARDAVWWLLSGMLVPLTMLPDAVGAVASVLPFASVTTTPALIYLGKVSTAESLRLIGVQAVWAVALWVLSQLAWRGASRQLTVHGG